MTELTTILYVEDDPDIQAVARLALEAVGGFTVTVASSGDEGIRAAQADRPDLILLDVMMPMMDGPTTLKALRADPRTADVPIVFVTATVKSTGFRHYKSLGALDVIPKPFDPMALAAVVRRIWAAHQPPAG